MVSKYIEWQYRANKWLWSKRWYRVYAYVFFAGVALLDIWYIINWLGGDE